MVSAAFTRVMMTFNGPLRRVSRVIIRTIGSNGVEKMREAEVIVHNDAGAVFGVILNFVVLIDFLLIKIV